MTEIWDPRDSVVALLDLCSLDMPDGDLGFIMGQDGVFTDVNGKVWHGSTLISVPKLQSAIDGIAPAGTIELAFFQDPAAPDLVAQVMSLGLDYLDGRSITFWVQPIRSMAEFQAPVLQPELQMTRTMRGITYSASGARDRRLTLGFEPWTEDRRAARRIALNTEGHAKLTGSANPSLSFMPTENFEEEALFG